MRGRLEEGRVSREVVGNEKGGRILRMKRSSVISQGSGHHERIQLELVSVIYPESTINRLPRAIVNKMIDILVAVIDLNMWPVVDVE